MAYITKALSGVLPCVCLVQVANAQAGQQVPASDFVLSDTGTVAAGPISPSAATATVSPSTVPQAMERLSGEGIVADVSLGSIYAGGKFGTASTTSIWSTAIGARVRAGSWRLSASLPWMRIRSRSTIFTSIDSTPVLVAPDTSPTKSTINGFGDLTLGATYTVTDDDAPLDVEVSGRAKINTASRNSRLSSGKNDYSLGVDVSMPVGAIVPFASFSYRFLGDIAGSRLHDGPAASAGASYAIGRDTILLASYHYSRAATRFVSDSHELFAGASTRLPRVPLRLTGFATAGLSRGAAAFSVGTALSFAFGDDRGG